MSRLVPLLQRAHAGEIAAYHAYKGHALSVKDLKVRRDILVMRQEELDHIERCERFLATLGAKPSPMLDLIFTIIGKVASALCYVTGYRLPMLVAKWLEQIGAVSYYELREVAKAEGQGYMSTFFLDMAYTEEEHERYFDKLLGNPRCKDCGAKTKAGPGSARCPECWNDRVGR